MSLVLPFQRHSPALSPQAPGSGTILVMYNGSCGFSSILEEKAKQIARVQGKYLGGRWNWRCYQLVSMESSWSLFSHNSRAQPGVSVAAGQSSFSEFGGRGKVGMDGSSGMDCESRDSSGSPVGESSAHRAYRRDCSLAFRVMVRGCG